MSEDLLLPDAALSQPESCAHHRAGKKGGTPPQTRTLRMSLGLEVGSGGREGMKAGTKLLIRLQKGFLY